MSKKHTSLISELRGKLKTCDSSHELSNIKSHYLGKNGILADEFVKSNTKKAKYQLLSTNKKESHYEMIKKLELKKSDFKEIKNIVIKIKF